MKLVVSLCVLAAVCVAVPVVSASARSGELRFLAMGDWGGQSGAPFTTEGEVAVAAQMSKDAAASGAEFILAIGDNFYSEGVTGVDDPRFKETFEDVFNKTSFPNQTFYVVAGNHDHKGNVQGEVEYSKRDSRWVFPSLYYTFTKTIPGTDKTVQILMIDTITLCDVGDPTQYNWIKSTLASSTADWLLVAGHYPIYSVAEHGPTACLIQYIKPLLLEYKVAAYFNGHDHNQQHLVEDGVDLDYYVTGGAHGLSRSFKHQSSCPPNSIKFFFPPESTKAVSSYINVAVTETQLTVQYIDNLGNMLYQTSKANPRAKH